MTITSQLEPRSNPRNTYPVIVMTTGVNPVTAGGNTAGWVSGNPANMASSSVVDTIFDLGPDWSMYTELCITLNPGYVSNGLTIAGTGADTPAINYSRYLQPLNYGSQTSVFYLTPTSVASMGGYYRPFGRYIVLHWSANSSSTNSSAQVSLAAYPGV